MDRSQSVSNCSSSTRSEARIQDSLNQRVSSCSSSTRSAAQMQDYLRFFTSRDSRIIAASCTVVATRRRHMRSRSIEQHQVPMEGMLRHDAFVTLPYLCCHVVHGQQSRTA